MAKSIVYIDGLNLYYGALKGTRDKWLDLEKYFTKLRQDDDIQKIKYFTARVQSRDANKRQAAYLRALTSLSLLEIIEGKFKMKEVQCTHLQCTFAGRRIFKCPEEKRTDVNIAIHLLDDAVNGLCDTHIIVSGDSDLVPAVEMVKLRAPDHRIIVYVPARNQIRGAATELRLVADRDRTLPTALISRCQLPTKVVLSGSTVVEKPPSW